jgi:sulfhydrogenase subunit beta (sulfur reductase)
MPAAENARTVVELEALNQLIPALTRRGYQVIGPTIHDGAIVYDTLRTLEDLPVGWTDEQEAGRYRLRKRDDRALFGYVVGPQSWKKFLHPPEVRLFEAQRDGGAFRILNGAGPAPRYAFLGVRACELAAIQVQDRVLIEDRFTDPIYQGRRGQIFVVTGLAVSRMQTSSKTTSCTRPPRVMLLLMRNPLAPRTRDTGTRASR